MTSVVRILYARGPGRGRTLVRAALAASDGGFRVTEVRSFAELREQLNTAAHDLLLSDLELPGCEGVQLLDAVKPDHPDLPAVIITADAELALEAAERGVTNRVGKSRHELRLLQYAIRDAIERKRLQLSVDMSDAHGEFSGCRGNGRDVTERVKADEDLRRFRLAMDHSADMILLIDRATMRFVDVNRTACQLLGYSREELLGMGPQDVLLASRQELERTYDEFIASPSSIKGVRGFYRRRDGATIPFESARHVLRSGDSYLIATISRDVREQLASEAALRDSNERFRSLTELSADVYWEQDDQHRFTSVMRNGTESGLTGRQGSLIGKRRWELNFLNMSAGDWETHIATLEAREPFRDLELCAINEAGKQVWISTSGEPVFDEWGVFKGYHGIGKDITARKRGEQLQALEHAVNRSLADADNVSGALQAAIRAVCETQGWECGRYFRWDEKAGALRFAEAWSIATPRVERFIEKSRELSYLPGVGLTGRVWQSLQPLWVPDLSSDPRAAQGTVATDAGMRGAFVFPVTSEGKALGVLAFSSGEIREPDDRMLQAVRVIGSQIGQFLQRKQAEEVLRESEERFRSLTELSSDWYWEQDSEFRFTTVVGHNPTGFEHMTGKTRWELDSAAASEAEWRAHRDVLEAHRPFRDFVYKYIDRAGKAGYLSISGEPIFDAQGQFRGYRGTGQDVTERVMVEEALQRFRAAMDVSADMIMLVDRETMHYVDVNATACQMQGYTREEMLLMGPQDVSPLSRGALERAYDETIASGGTTRAESYHQRKDGTRFPVEICRRALRSGDRWIIASIVRDISDRRRAEAELRRSEERFRSLTALASDVYWEQDDQYRFTTFADDDADPALANWQAMSIGKKRWELHYLNMTVADWASHIATLDARQPFRSLELCAIKEDGKQIWVSSSGEPMFDEAGAFKGYRGIANDITARKHSEQLQGLEHAVNRSLADADSVSGAVQAAVRAVCDTQGWECGRYFRWDQKAGALRFSDAWGIATLQLERFIEKSREISYLPGVGLAGRVWQSLQPVWVPDLTSDPRVARGTVVTDAGMRGAFVFPVTSEGKAIGVLAFNSREIREPDERMLQAVRVIGSQIGQFLQRKEAEEDLRRFRAAMDASADMIWLIDPAGMRILDVNDTVCRTLGYSREELLAMGPQDVVCMSRGELAEIYTRLIAGDMRETTVAGFYRLKDGSQLPMESMRRVVRSAEGHVILAIARDTTQRRRVEEDLRRFRLAMDNSADMIVLIDRATMRFVDVNSTVCNLLGYSREELLQMGPQDVLPASREELERAYDAFIAEPSSVSGMRSQYRCKDGTIIPFESTRRVLRSGDSYLIAAISRDVRERIASETALRESNERFNTAVSATNDVIWDWNLVTNEVWLNENFNKVFGYRQEDVDPNVASWFDAIHADDRDRVVRGIQRIIDSGGKNWSDEYRFRRQDGSYAYVLDRGHVIHDGAGKALRMIGAMADITGPKRAEETVRNQARQQRLIAEFGQQALASADVGSVMNQAVELVVTALRADCCDVLEFEPDKELLTYRAAAGWPKGWLGRRERVQPGGAAAHVLAPGTPLIIEDYRTESRFPPSPLVQHGARSSMQVHIPRAERAFGMLRVHTLEPRRFTDEDVSFLQSVANILAVAIERKSAEDRLAHLAQFDTVTGLPNRYLFRDRLSQTITQAQRNHWLVAMLFIDLDRFKAVNDTYGHSAGDRLLSQVGARLKECVRTGDTVGRLSGDEFAVVLSNLAKADDAGLVAQKVMDALAAPFELDGHQTYVSASVGIALYPGDGKEPDTLIKNADTAMYRAKEQGRGSYQFYLPQMNERLMERLRLEAHLRGALLREEFLLHYQPKVNLATGTISGFEALLRWRHGDTVISPAEFIPILEDTGLIVPVGEWVLRSVCAQLRQWEREGLAPRPIAVNLSARQFQHRNLPAVVGQVLNETGIAPDLLELELTESLLMSDAEEAVQMLHQLKSLGVRLAVDDFGTGYSSLSYLKRFPLDALKIDRTFIRDAIADPDDATITITIISLAHSLKLKVVAEGVETEAQLNLLRSHGCDEMQGFYFSRPLPADDCTRVLAEDRRLQSSLAKTTPELPALLLVDDNEDDLQLLEQALATAGFRVLTAGSAKAGFDVLARHGADIVVSDQRMPEMSGVEFLSNVKKLYPNAVRVVASGGGDAHALADAINHAGVHKFLSKEWDTDRLRAEVQEAYQHRR